MTKIEKNIKYRKSLFSYVAGTFFVLNLGSFAETKSGGVEWNAKKFANFMLMKFSNSDDSTWLEGQNNISTTQFNRYKVHA